MSKLFTNYAKNLKENEFSEKIGKSSSTENSTNTSEKNFEGNKNKQESVEENENDHEQEQQQQQQPSSSNQSDEETSETEESEENNDQSSNSAVEPGETKKKKNSVERTGTRGPAIHLEDLVPFLHKYDQQKERKQLKERLKKNNDKLKNLDHRLQNSVYSKNLKKKIISDTERYKQLKEKKNKL